MVLKNSTSKNKAFLEKSPLKILSDMLSFRDPMARRVLLGGYAFTVVTLYGFRYLLPEFLPNLPLLEIMLGVSIIVGVALVNEVVKVRESVEAKEESGIPIAFAFGHRISTAVDAIIEVVGERISERPARSMVLRVISANMQLPQQLITRLIASMMPGSAVIALRIYHPAVARMRGWTTPDLTDQRAFEARADDIAAVRADLERQIADSTFHRLTCEFIEYIGPPTEFACLIDEDELFWGPINWNTTRMMFDEENSYWFQLSRDSVHARHILDWILKKCRTFDAWEVADWNASLGFIGTLKDRVEIGRELEKIPQITNLKILGFSAEKSFLRGMEDRVRRVIHDGGDVELTLINSDSKFVAVRATEHPGQTPSSMKGIAERGRGRAEELERMALEAANPAPQILTQYDRWAIWRLVFVNNDHVYASFYPIDENGDHPKVWVFKRDDERRSMYWPLLKAYMAYKFLHEDYACPMTADEFHEIIKEEFSKS